MSAAPYLVHGTTLALAWFLIVNAAVSALVVVAAARLTNVPRAASPGFWLALRLLPAAFSILFVGVVPTYLALQLYEAGLKRVEATRAVTIATLEPVIAAVLAYLVWGESWGPLGIAGAVLVLAGVLTMARARPANPLS